ncbi:MAG: diaminopimelate epimerase, partial [Tistlia sp.]
MPVHIAAMTGRPFRKMHGLGNDFVIVDARLEPFRPSAAQAAAIADRREGVGCDQLIVLEPDAAPADLFMRIFNADGSEAEACGNATRCVASLLFAEGREAVTIRTLGGLLPCTPAADGQVTADLGPPRLDWREVPLARAMDTGRLDYAKGPLADPVALSLGNPHVVFFVEDPEGIDLAALGPAIEHDPLFPRRTNVQLVQVVSTTHLRQRIWERGVGLTRASGSGGCAAQVAAVRRGLTERRARVEQPGG